MRASVTMQEKQEKQQTSNTESEQLHDDSRASLPEDLLLHLKKSLMQFMSYTFAPSVAKPSPSPKATDPSTPTADFSSPATLAAAIASDKTAVLLTTRPTADAGDESLQRYKESLGLAAGQDLSDPNDPRVCIIQSLTMEAAGREPVTIDLSAPGSEKTLKDKPFKIKEGAKFTMVATFKVQHEILSGLHYVQIVKRKGIKVSKDSEMIVSSLSSLSYFAPY